MIYLPADATRCRRRLVVRTLDRLAEQEALAARFFLRVVSVIAAIPLLLSTAGIYALVSFTLARSTREIGIRVALGAAPVRARSRWLAPAGRTVSLGVSHQLRSASQPVVVAGC